MALAPMEVIVYGLREVVAPRFDGLRDYLRTRREIVRSDEGLRERELRKLSILADAGAVGFRERGLNDFEAILAARLSVVVFDAAVTRWLDQDSEKTFAHIITEAALMIQLAAGSKGLDQGSGKNGARAKQR